MRTKNSKPIREMALITKEKPNTYLQETLSSKTSGAEFEAGKMIAEKRPIKMPN